MTQPIPVHERIYQATVHQLERFTEGRYWQLKMVGLSLVVCFALSFPDYQLDLKSSRNPETWRVVNQQIHSPFTAVPASELPPPSSNEAKRVFRLFMPVLGHVLRLERGGLLVVQNLMGVVFLWVAVALIYKVTADRITAAFFVLSLSLTFTSLWFFNSFSTNLDGPGYLLLLLSLLVPSAIPLSIILFLATFVDERVFACFGFVVIWWKIDSCGPDAWTWRRIFSVDRYVLAACCAVLLHGIIRYYLTSARGFHLPLGDAGGVSFSTMREGWTVFSPSIIAPFKGLSLFAVLAAIVTAANRKWSLLLGTMLIAVAVLAQSFAVGDQTRSMAYGFPLIVLSVKILKELDPGLNLRKMSALTCALCLLVPSFCVEGGVVTWFTPILPKALRWFF